MSEIDLAHDPAKMFAGAENAKDYTFYLVKESSKYTQRAFSINPNAATGADTYFKSPMIPDKAGKALADLEKESDSIIKKLGNAVKTDARAVVVASSKPTNNDPRKRDAIVQRVTLVAPKQSIKLTAIKDRATKADWVTHHHSILFVQAEIRGIPTFTFEIDPKTPWPDTPCLVTGVWIPVAPGQKAPQRMLVGSVGQNCHGKCGIVGHHDGGWWGLWAAQFNGGFKPFKVGLPQGVEHVVFGFYPRYPGTTVLKVKGTGEFEKHCETIGVAFEGPHSNPGD